MKGNSLPQAVTQATNPIWRELPPTIREFITGSAYLNTGVIGEVNPATGKKHKTGIRLPLLQFLESLFPDPLNISVHEVWIKAGRGAGKTVMAVYIHAYLVCRALCMRNWREYYGLDDNTTMYCINVSQSGKQANDVVFKRLKNTIAKSPWFKGKVIIQKYRIIYIGQQLESMPGNSEDDAWRGYDPFIIIVDEYAFHPNAEESHDVVEAGISSRFHDPDRYGLIIGISSVKEEGDPIEHRYNLARDEMAKAAEEGRPPRMVGFTITTWDSEGITMDEYALKHYGGFDDMGQPADGRKTRAEFDQEFGNIPPLVSDAFFKYPEKIAACPDSGEPPVTLYEATTTRMLDDGKVVTYVAKDWEFHIPRVGSTQPQLTYYIGVDGGVSRDAYAVAITHARASIPATLATDLSTSWRPDPSRSITVDVLNVEDFVIDFAKSVRRAGHKVGKVLGDSYNSASLEQKLMQMGIDTDFAVASNPRQVAHYKRLQTLIYARLISLPHSNLVLMDELRRLKLEGTGTGSKITHPANGGKDEADGLALAAWGCSEDTAELVIPRGVAVAAKDAASPLLPSVDTSKLPPAPVIAGNGGVKEAAVVKPAPQPSRPAAPLMQNPREAALKAIDDVWGVTTEKPVKQADIPVESEFGQGEVIDLPSRRTKQVSSGERIGIRVQKRGAR